MSHADVSDATCFHCPVEATLDVIGGKWKVVILFWLKDGTLRFGELRKKIPGVSERMLTQQLRELEGHGIIHREVYPEVPPKVEYSLTEYGKTLRPITELMCAWGKTHLRRSLVMERAR
jgi:DNA-binding HxlR family transcriptional regulator